MKITKKCSGKTLEIALEGRLDPISAPDLEQQLNESLNGIDDLILDFSGLDYISSAGLRVMLYARQVLLGRGSVKIVHANELVREVFTVTGMDGIIKLE